MRVETIELVNLREDVANARRHPERQIDALKAALVQFGQQKPIVIDKANVVRAGNGVLRAARALGWTHLECVRTDLDGLRVTAFSLADNRLSELSEWDHEAVSKLLA